MDLLDKFYSVLFSIKIEWYNTLHFAFLTKLYMYNPNYLYLCDYFYIFMWADGAGSSVKSQ